MSFTTKIINSKKLKKIKIIQPSINEDFRGQIFSMFDQKLSTRLLPKKYYFSHMKITNRKKNVLVGIHYDSKTWKLFGCVNGRVFHSVTCFDKKDKKNYLKSEKFILQGGKKSRFILIPPNYGNAFYCFENSMLLYGLSYKKKYNDIGMQKTVFWRNKNLNIRWPCKNPILSKRDKFILKKKN